jgi:hypothetical protein
MVFAFVLPTKNQITSVPLERCPECGGLGGHLGTCQRVAKPFHESKLSEEVRQGRPQSGDDLLFGAIFLAIGLFITFGTAAAAAKFGTNNGGIIFAYGPVAYGAIRMIRGLVRAFFG